MYIKLVANGENHDGRLGSKLTASFAKPPSGGFVLILS